MNRFLYECRRRLAILLASFELHRLSHEQINGRTYLVKTRSRLATLVVPVGNWYLRVIRADSVVLPTAEWQNWERTVMDAVIRPKGIAVPMLPGESLDRALSRADVTMDRKLNCIALALRALLRLHERPVVWTDGQTRRLSHGDATAENVCVDDLRQSACWFDFDMRHRPGIPEIHRHADDLRSLIFSSAVHLAADQYDQLAQVFVTEVRSPDLLAEFRFNLAGIRRHPNTLHLAQAPLTCDQHLELCNQLQGKRNEEQGQEKPRECRPTCAR